jgi:hypothetical protein
MTPYISYSIQFKLSELSVVGLLNFVVLRRHSHLRVWRRSSTFDRGENLQIICYNPRRAITLEENWPFLLCLVRTSCTTMLSKQILNLGVLFQTWETMAHRQRVYEVYEEVLLPPLFYSVSVLYAEEWNADYASDISASAMTSDSSSDIQGKGIAEWIALYENNYRLSCGRACWF